MSVKQIEPTAELEVKGDLLSLVAEGKPYVFLTVELGEDENGTYVETHIVADVPVEIIVSALEVALAEVTEGVVAV